MTSKAGKSDFLFGHKEVAALPNEAVVFIKRSGSQKVDLKWVDPARNIILGDAMLQKHKLVADEIFDVSAADRPENKMIDVRRSQNLRVQDGRVVIVRVELDQREP